MTSAFQQRYYDIINDANILSVINQSRLKELELFASRYFDFLPRSESRVNATFYFKGLLSEIDRKNMESIAYRFQCDRQPIQKFIGQSNWDHTKVYDKIAKDAAELIGEDDGIIVFDPSAFEKCGKKSAGVARQWDGRHGKVDNAQVGIFMAYVTRNEHVITNAKLFIPEEWNNDPERCKIAHIPEIEYVTHKTRHIQCLEMLSEQGHMLPHAWIAGDDEMGRSSAFRAALRKINESYVFASPSNTLVCKIGWTEEMGFKSVHSIMESLKKKDWKTVYVRDGEKCKLELQLSAHKVIAHTEKETQIVETLIIAKRKEGKGYKVDYYISNGPDETSIEEYGRVIIGSHRIEDCFKRAKSHCGLSEYELQTWTGWHHHICISLMATLFVTKELQRSKKKVHRSRFQYVRS